VLPPTLVSVSANKLATRRHNNRSSSVEAADASVASWPLTARLNFPLPLQAIPFSSVCQRNSPTAKLPRHYSSRHLAVSLLKTLYISCTIDCYALTISSYLPE
jgi:hypothetical protein